MGTEASWCVFRKETDNGYIFDVTVDFVGAFIAGVSLKGTGGHYVVLDREDVIDLRDALTEWLERTQ